MPVQTQEYAKNATAEVKIRCSGCGKQYLIAEMMKERSLPYPNVDVVEGYLECPTCGAQVHSYYMTELLRHAQVMLKNAILKWQREKTNVAWSEYERRQKVFKNNFDKVQERYKELLKESQSGTGNNNAQLQG